jgi:hypothetical protein
MKGRPVFTLCAVLALLTAFPGFAGIIYVDENGDSLIFGIPGVISLPARLAPDPGPGGAASTLTYTLPFTTVIGDVTFVSASDPGILFGGDVVRFNGGTLVFYSDTTFPDVADSLADTPGPPGAFYTNVAAATEIGPDTDNRANYSPLAGQPGFHLLSDGTPVSYIFQSDVPEPSSGLLIVMGMGVCVLSSILKRSPKRT